MELRWRLRQPPAVEGVSRGSDPVNGFELEDKRSRTGAKLLRGFALTDSFPRFRPPRLARREDWCGLMLRQAGLWFDAVFRVFVAPAQVTAGALTTKVLGPQPN